MVGWYFTGNTAAQIALAKDNAFIIQRQTSHIKMAWPTYNESHAINNNANTTPGYLPITVAPAHNLEIYLIFLQHI